MIYECSGCGKKRDGWPDGWSWYGSIADLEDSGVYGVTCGKSDACDLAAEIAGTPKKKKKPVSSSRPKAARARERALAKLTEADRRALELE